MLAKKNRSIVRFQQDLDLLLDELARLRFSPSHLATEYRPKAMVDGAGARLEELRSFRDLKALDSSVDDDEDEEEENLLRLLAF